MADDMTLPPEPPYMPSMPPLCYDPRSIPQPPPPSSLIFAPHLHEAVHVQVTGPTADSGLVVRDVSYDAVHGNFLLLCVAERWLNKREKQRSVVLMRCTGTTAASLPPVQHTVELQGCEHPLMLLSNDTIYIMDGSTSELVALDVATLKEKFHRAGSEWAGKFELLYQPSRCAEHVVAVGYGPAEGGEERGSVRTYRASDGEPVGKSVVRGNLHANVTPHTVHMALKDGGDQLVILPPESHPSRCLQHATVPHACEKAPAGDADVQLEVNMPLDPVLWKTLDVRGGFHRPSQCGARSTLIATGHNEERWADYQGISTRCTCTTKLALHDTSIPGCQVVAQWRLPADWAWIQEFGALVAACWRAPGVLCALWHVNHNYRISQLWVRHVPWHDARQHGLVPPEMRAVARALVGLRWRGREVAATPRFASLNGAANEELAWLWAALPLEVFDLVSARLWDDYLRPHIILPASVGV